MGSLLCVICCFSLAAFNICSFCLIFLNLINMCFGVFRLGLSCLELSGFLGLGWIFPSPFQGSFQLLSPQIFSHALSFCFLLLGHLCSNVGAFNIVPEISEAVLLYFYSFFHSASFISTILSSSSLVLSSASVPLLLVHCRVF